MDRAKSLSQRAQALVEFAPTVALFMFLVVAFAQVALDLHYRSALQASAEEGAFEASLAGHQPGDAKAATQTLWSGLEPGGGTVNVTVTAERGRVAVTARSYAPALLPVPLPPFLRLPVVVTAVHTIERFQPGSS